jgi:hypothetical protein
MKVGKQITKQCGTCFFRRQRTQSVMSGEEIVQAEVTVCSKDTPTVLQQDITGIWPPVELTDICGAYRYDGTS